MQRRRTMWVTAAAVCSMVGGGLVLAAEDASKDSSDMYRSDSGQQQQQAQPGQQGRMGQAQQQAGPVIRASEAIGKDVKNAQGQNLGEIQDLVLDLEHGRVSYAAISSGGFLGIGEKFTAVPWQSLQPGKDKDTYTLNVTKEQLQQAPSFDKNNWPDVATYDFPGQVYSHFGQQPYWQAQAGMGAMDQQGPQNLQSLRDRVDQAQKSVQQAQQSVQQAQGKSPQEQAQAQLQLQQAQQQLQQAQQQLQQAQQQLQQRQQQPQGQQQQPMQRQSGQMGTGQTGLSVQQGQQGGVTVQQQGQAGQQQMGQMGQGQQGQQGQALETGGPKVIGHKADRMWARKASNLIGLTVKDAQGQDLGEVQDLVIDQPSGRIAYAVLSYGGIMGMGDKLFAVPFAALTVDATNERFVSNTDREQLRNAPGFDKNNWPDMANPRWGETVHAHYGATPYWQVTAGMAAGMQGFEANSRYNQLYNQQTVKDFSGTIQSVDKAAPMAGMDQATRCQIRTDDGQTITCHLGPASFIDQQNLNLREGQRIQLSGSQVTLDGQQVVLAKQCTINGKTVQLRNEQGQPLWTQQQQQQQPQFQRQQDTSGRTTPGIDEGSPGLRD